MDFPCRLRALDSFVLPLHDRVCLWIWCAVGKANSRWACHLEKLGFLLLRPMGTQALKFTEDGKIEGRCVP